VITGWRIGWAIACDRITQRIRKVHDFLTVGAPTPFQQAGLTALAMPESYYDELRAMYLKARDFLFGALQEVGFVPYLPKGSYYIMVEADELMKQFSCEDDFAFSRKLIEKTGVATVPGTSFYMNNLKGNNQVRFTYCKKMKTLEQVKDRLLKLVR